VKVTEVFKTNSDAAFLERAGVKGLDDPNYDKYSERQERLRGIRKFICRMDVLERKLSYDEVTPLFQHIVTTTSRPPDELVGDERIRLKLKGAPAQARLLMRDL
jgi:hypothetical protein